MEGVMEMQASLRRAASVVMLAGVMAAAAACSSTAGKTVADVPGKLVDPPIGTVFSGKALAGMLGQVPFPAGFAADGQTSANSGAQIAPNSFQGPLASTSCEDVAVLFGEEGVGESSYASDGAMTADKKDGLSLIAYQFASDSAAGGFYSAAVAKWRSCGSFTEAGDSTSSPLSVVMSTAPAPAVPGASKVIDLSEVVSEGDASGPNDYVMALDGDAVVLGEVVTFPAPQFPGGIKDAASLDGQLLVVMNAAQLATPAVSATARPVGRYGIGN